jgi:hypothetical protein
MLGWGPSFTTKLSAFIFGRLATNKILVVYETTRLIQVKLDLTILQIIWLQGS